MNGRGRSTGPGQPAERPPAPPAARLRIVGPPGGRWRAGRRWGPEPVEVDPEALGPAAVAALRADPLLAVTDPTEDPPPSDA